MISRCQNGRARKRTCSNWIKTRTQHLCRHSKSGRYYVRAYRQGREVWKALGTISYKAAKGNARETLKEIQKSRTLTDALLSGKPTSGQAAELYREHIKTRNLSIRILTYRGMFPLTLDK
jgi:hypothetical protein